MCHCAGGLTDLGSVKPQLSPKTFCNLRRLSWMTLLHFSPVFQSARIYLCMLRLAVLCFRRRIDAVVIASLGLSTLASARDSLN